MLSEQEIRSMLANAQLTSSVSTDQRAGDNGFRIMIFEKYLFHKRNFADINLSRRRFSFCYFHSCSFRQAQLRNSVFGHCIFKRVDFTASELIGVRFVNCLFEQSDFGQADVDHIYFNNCFFNSTGIDALRNINDCRVLAGQVLRHYAGQSAVLHSIADFISDETLSSASLLLKTATLPSLYRKWIACAGRKLPESGLSQNWSKMGIAVEDEPSEHHRTLDTIRPKDFAILLVGNTRYYAATKGRNIVKSTQIKGKLIDYHPDHKQHGDQSAIISILAENGPIPEPGEIYSIHWPYPPLDTLSTERWNENALNNLDEMIADEQYISNMICNYLEDRLEKVETVVDMACSHGYVLWQLQALKPSLRLIGRDIASAMLASATKRLPKADIQFGSSIIILGSWTGGETSRNR